MCLARFSFAMMKPAAFALLLLSLGALMPAAKRTEQPDLHQLPDKPRILVVNDDGIQSAGIAALAESLSEIGEVIVVAPDGNRSGTSASSTLFSTTLSVKKVDIQGATEAYSVSGTPTDAADFGLVHIGKDRPFDIIVSGINAGSNVGEVAHYSGTVGAAMEGPAFGIPGIAISQSGRRNFDRSARFAATFLRQLIDKGADTGVVYSINVPNKPKEELDVSPAPMGGRYLQFGNFRKLENKDDSEQYRAQIRLEKSSPIGSDTAEVFAGKISITPLLYNWTSAPILERLKSWEFETVK
jgi:5'-nucleotidase